MPAVRTALPCAFTCAVLLALCGCTNDQHEVAFTDAKLPSGKNVKVTSLYLARGQEHDERMADKDCFAMEFVYSAPDAKDDAREREAKEAFEFIRPLSEQFGFKLATVAGFPTQQRKGHYDLFVFQRAANNGPWSSKRVPSKVFAND